MYLYSLYDYISQTYEPPLAFASDEEAARTLAHLCVSTGSIAHSFILYLVGYFDCNTGKFEASDLVKIPNFQLYYVKGLENVPSKKTSQNKPKYRKKSFFQSLLSSFK